MATYKRQIDFVLYQNKNEESKAYGKWYGRAVINETVGVEDIAKRIYNFFFEECIEVTGKFSIFAA